MKRLARQILVRGRRRGTVIATAESCTGGMLAAALTDLPGASDVFAGGYVTYSNAMKRNALGVQATTLDTHGAVSEPVAREMAVGARARTGADLAIAVTGIAGPGGSEFKPEGRVCFALASAGTVQAETVEFGALGRERVRRAARDHALRMVLHALG
ncbi:MAG: CinA family protein [Pararhodobacter sp.]